MKRIVVIVATVFTLIVTLALGGSLIEGVDASEIVLIQSPTGTLSWHISPGWVWQGFGKVTRYQKRGIVQFQPGEDDDSFDGRLPIVFNDAARGQVKGSMNFELPLDTENLNELHSAYPNAQALENGLIRPALNKSVFLTGTLMTSYESYKEKRSMLIQYVEDQTQNGVYQTRTVERDQQEETIDAAGQPTTTTKRVTVVEIAERDGQRLRQETGQLARFGVKAFNFAIEDLDYEDSVDKQIRDQQGITMAVQTSIANAKKAIQDALTAKAQGDANIATARATEEIEKTKQIVQGERQRDVARLKAEEAEAYKREQLLRADADAEYRRRIMQADNALTQRLEAYKYGVDRIATAIAQYQGQWTPSVMVGGSGQGAGQFNAVQSLIDLALVNQAKQLGLDLGAGRVSSNTAPAAVPTGGRGAAPAPERAQARR